MNPSHKINTRKWTFEVNVKQDIHDFLPDWDLITCIRQLQFQEINYTWQTIKWHKDQTDAALTILEQLNVEMDYEARKGELKLKIILCTALMVQ